MRYFFLIYALIALLVVSIGGFRGDKFKNPPIQIFPDMDDQDRIDDQEASSFFSDGMGARKPVASTLPQGLEPADGGATQQVKTLANDTSYLHTGMFDEANYGEGMPSELGLTADNAAAFLKRGESLFQANCSHCHGQSGNGKGVVASYGIPAVADLQTIDRPAGAIFDVISNGKGNMMSLKHNFPDVKDRWAVVAYIKALQFSRKAPADKVKDALEAGLKAEAN